MKKLLSSVSLSALALCFTVQFAHAIKTLREEGEGEGENKRIVKLANKKTEESNFSIFGIPDEAQVIIIWQLRHDLDVLIPMSSVSKLWNNFINKHMLRKDLNFSTITDQDAKIDPGYLIRLNLVNNTILTDGGLKFFSNLTDLDLSSQGEQYDSVNLITNVGLNRLEDLRKLKLNYNIKITDAGIKPLNNLTSLCLAYDWDVEDDEEFEPISNIGIQELTNLDTLILESNSALISGEGLKCLSKLSSLSLLRNDAIVDEDIKNLSNLTSLSLQGNYEIPSPITNDGISKLTKLETLRVHNNADITNDGFKGFTNLTSLSLHFVGRATGDSFKEFINLTSLSLQLIDNTTDDVLKGLINLTYLRLMDLGKEITDDGIKDLTKLSTLIVKSPMEKKTPSFTGYGIGHLKNLTTLKLELREKFTDEEITPLANLPYLINLKLIFDQNKLITNEGLKPLCNVPHLILDIFGNDIITDQEIQHFTNISKLKINANIKLRGLETLTNIPCLKDWDKYLKKNNEYTAYGKNYLSEVDKYFDFGD